MHSAALQWEGKLASPIADAMGSLQLALAAVLTLCASTFASGDPVKAARQDEPPHVPHELLVRFRQDAPVAARRGVIPATCTRRVDDLMKRSR